MSLYSDRSEPYIQSQGNCTRVYSKCGINELFTANFLMHFSNKKNHHALNKLSLLNLEMSSQVCTYCRYICCTPEACAV